ncbi:MAG: PAS domain S-box protein, partial [Candidatus Omnitrophota bacterium]
MSAKGKTKERLLKDIEALEAKIRKLEAAQSVYRQEARSARVFKTIADKANYGVAISDLDGNLIYVNDIFANMHGYSPEEVVGENLNIFHNKEQIKAVAELNTLLKRKGSYAGEEVWHSKKDGTVFPTMMNATVIKNEKRKPLFLSATAIDVTDRKVVEAECGSSEERYRILFESSIDGIAAVDLDTRKFILANPAMCRMTGYSEEELKEVGIRDFHPKKKLKELMPLFEAHVRGEETASRNIPCLKKDGEVVYMDINTAAKIKIDGKECLLGVLRDATERKTIEEALKESEEKYRLLVECARQPIFSFSKKGVLLFLNAHGAKMLGGKPKDFIGKTMWDLFPKKTADGQMKTIRDVIKTGKLRISERENEIKEKKYWFQACIQPLKNEVGEFDSAFVIATDITEYKLTEQRIVKLNETFLSLGSDFNKNIEILTKTCGELLEGTCALYNKLKEGLLCSVGKWHVPSDYNPMDNPDGHICFDVIKTSKKGKPYIVKNLQETAYQQSDSNVARYNLKTYIGIPVYCFGKCVGSLCVVYQKDVEFSESDKKLLGIIAEAISREEERKRVEEGVKRTSEQLSIMLDSLPIISYTCKIDGDYDATYLSESVVNVVGYKAEDFTSNASFWADHIHPDDKQRVFADLRNIFKVGHHEHEYRFRIADGSYKWFCDILNLVRFPDGTPSHIVGVWHDITERKNAELELKKQSEALDTTNKELTKKLEELQMAMSHIKKLEGLVPICAKCKKIRVEAKKAKKAEIIMDRIIEIL